MGMKNIKYVGVDAFDADLIQNNVSFGVLYVTAKLSLSSLGCTVQRVETMKIQRALETAVRDAVWVDEAGKEEVANEGR